MFESDFPERFILTIIHFVPRRNCDFRDHTSYQSGWRTYVYGGPSDCIVTVKNLDVSLSVQYAKNLSCATPLLFM
jgi:hypothetical protein